VGRCALFLPYSLGLAAFDNSEAKLVSDFAVNLLHEKSTINIITLVAIDNDVIIGHVAFSCCYCYIRKI
jgi:putative acetyltransferase